jgi:hypothetical protein
MVIAKFLASTATLAGYYIFMTTIHTLLSTNLAGLEVGGFAKSLFLILFMCGGGLAVMAFSDVVANLIGEAAGVREGMSSMKSTVAGGMMAMGAGKVVGKAVGMSKSNRAKKALANSNKSNFGTDNSQMDAGDGETSPADVRGYGNNPNKGVDTRAYTRATSGMASRAGIVGLAGIALGATTLGASVCKV